MTWHGFPGPGTKVRLCLAASAVFLGLSACDSPTTGPLDIQTSQMRVLLTDAPSDMLDSANVWISRIYLQGGGGTEPDTASADSTATDSTSASTAGRVDLYNDPDHALEYDLLTLTDSVTADLTGLVTVDAGTYQGLRFVVDSARVSLKAPYTFEDGSTSAVLAIPSGSTSGIKVKLKDILMANAGDTTTVTVDFDVEDNFVIQVSQHTGQVRKILFTPVLKAVPVLLPLSPPCTML